MARLQEEAKACRKYSGGVLRVGDEDIAADTIAL